MPYEDEIIGIVFLAATI